MNFKSYAVLTLSLLLTAPLLAQATLNVIQQKNSQGSIGQEFFYENGTLVESKYYNQNGELMSWFRFNYPVAGHVVKSFLGTTEADRGRIITKEQWTGLQGPRNESSSQSVLVKKWFYAEQAPFALQFVASFDAKGRIVRKEYFANNDKLLSTLEIKWIDGRSKPAGFTEKDASGKTIRNYSQYEKFDLEASLKEVGKSPDEIRLLKKQRENPDKFLVAILDSGFDYNHPALVNKWWNNPSDPIDGIDNDGNGWTDDNFGWDQQSKTGLPSEVSTAFDQNERPLSHGTHVANIASFGLNNIGLIGLGGDYTEVAYIEQVSAFLKKHKVRIVNMSLGIPQDFKDLLGLKATVKAYQKMIENNPDTLFVVAAGNAAQDIDIAKNRQYPASFTHDNVLKVGALDVPSVSAIDPAKVKMATFSNFGKSNVDILAPGDHVVAASLGGGTIAHSGTSMASPYMVHEIVQLWSQFPDLKPIEIKNLFNATAHRLNVDVPVKSNGYVDLKAALLQAKIHQLQGTTPASNGPNCWNTATYLAGLSTGVHYTTEDEVRFLLDSPLCQEVPAGQTIKGDILALRRFDSAGKLLPAAFMSEVHAYTELGDGMGLSKNGTDQEVDYAFQKKSDVFEFYRSKEFQNCKIIGVERKNCLLKEKAYRCQSLKEYLKGRRSVVENDVLMQIEKLEQELSGQFLRGNKIQGDKTVRIGEIQRRVAELRSQGAGLLLTEYLEFRLSSLASQF